MAPWEMLKTRKLKREGDRGQRTGDRPPTYEKSAASGGQGLGEARVNVESNPWVGRPGWSPIGAIGPVDVNLPAKTSSSFKDVIKGHTLVREGGSQPGGGFWGEDSSPSLVES